MKCGIILAAGFGKRMKKLSANIPKPLIRINNKPFLKYSIDVFNKLDFDKIIINVHYKAEKIINYITSLDQNNIEISDERNCLLDTGGGIKNIFDNFNINQALVINSDVIWSENHIKKFKFMMDTMPTDANAYLALASIENYVGYHEEGDFIFIDQYNIKRYQRGDSNPLAFIGAQIIERNAFSENEDKAFSINKTWDKCLKNNKLKGFNFATKVLHLGTEAALKEYISNEKKI